jgi:hypothetical protein
MKLARTTCLAAAAALALALAGCHDAYQQEPTQPASTPPARAPENAGRPSGRGPVLPLARDTRGRSARAATNAFARTWINWDWRTVAAQQRSLARLAAGRLAADLRANARTTTVDASLARDRPSSRGTVIAADLRPRREMASAIVVTHEQTYTDGHADVGGQHHRVYRALLTRGAHGWEVRAWTPLP